MAPYYESKEDFVRSAISLCLLLGNFIPHNTKGTDRFVNCHTHIITKKLNGTEEFDFFSGKELICISLPILRAKLIGIFSVFLIKLSLPMNPKLTQKAKPRKKRASVENELPLAKSPSDFSFTVTKTAVAQICQSVGYKRTQLLALENLTHVATKYLQAIAKSAVSFSNASNRSESNLFDIVNAIHDLYALRGFPGGSEMHKRKLLGFGAMKEIMNFVKHSKEVPFAKPVPSNNSLERSNPELTFDSGLSLVCYKESNMQGLHIPSWLPDFPNERLYEDCDQVLYKERKCGEKLWEHLVSVEDYGVDMKENGKVSQSNGVGGKEGKEQRTELARYRERVKFKIGGEEEKLVGLGVNMMNVVRKGGKRVCLNHNEINDSIDWEK